MNYASALLSGRGSSPAPAPAPKPISRPAPSPIAPPKTAASAASPSKAHVVSVDPTEAAGPFARLPVPLVVKIAVLAGPQGTCNLGVTCRYIFEKVLNNAFKSVQDQMPKTKKPLIKIRLDLAGTTADVEEGEEAPEVKAGGKVLSLPLAQFQRDSERVKLVSYWLDIVTSAQTERNASQKKSADASKDPLAVIKKAELKVVLGGGFNIDTAGKQRAKRLYASGSLSDVHLWLEAAVALLQGSLEQKLHLDSGLVVLQRVGRGGSLVLVKNGLEKGLFDLADFVLALRGSAKDFLPFVGRCIVTLKNGVKQFQQEGEAEQYIERENVIKTVLKHQSLDRSLKSLKHLLEVGAVPNSNLPQIFAKKRAEKMRAQSQAFIEYDNMWDFVTSNLPGDYEKAKEEAVRLNEQAEKDRDSARARADEARSKAIEERKAKEASKAAARENKNADKGEEEETKKKEKRDKKVEFKSVDKDGWVTREVQTVKPDGTIEKAAAPVAAAPEPEQPKGKKAQNQNQKGKQQEKGKQQQQKQEPAPKKAPVVEEASKEYLDLNPYAAAMREGSFQSQADAQFKRNMEKAAEKPQPKKAQQQPQQAQKKGGQPQQQKEQKPAQPKQQQPAQQKKPAQQQNNNNNNKGQKEAKKAMKVKPAAQSSEWLTPAIVIGAVAVTIVLGYTFLIGA